MALDVMGQSLSQDTRLLVLRSDSRWCAFGQFTELTVRLLRVDGIWDWATDDSYLRLSGPFTDFAITLEAVKLALQEFGIAADELTLLDADDLTEQARKVADGTIAVGDYDL